MLVGGSFTNTAILKQETVDSSSQIAVSASPITTKVAVETSQSKSSSKQNTNVKNNLGVEEAVREYFADIPLMVEVSKCESRYRQFEPNGEVFRGKINANDVGALQINETYHLSRAKKLGYDVHSLQGNMAYARLLYEESGAQPWSSSYPCWGKSPLAANIKLKSRTKIVTVAQAAPAATAEVSAVASSSIASVTEAAAKTVEVLASAPTTVTAEVEVPAATSAIAPVAVPAINTVTSVLADR